MGNIDEDHDDWVFKVFPELREGVEQSLEDEQYVSLKYHFLRE